MKTLVIFGSKSDEKTYNEIATSLKEKGIEYELRVASAHKTPDLVRQILQNEYDVIVAGAGLAAHLPGVVAAEKIVPVLGVACPGAYNGLDAFLSIIQMPPGIPVLQVNAENVAAEIRKMNKKRIVLVGEGKVADKAAKTLTEMNVPFDTGSIQDDAINIVITPFGEPVKQRNELIIYCAEGNPAASEAHYAMEAAQFGLWVGVNRGENAAIAAAEIGRYENEVSNFRKAQAEKVRKADAEVRE